MQQLLSAGFGPFFFSQLRLDEIDEARIGRVSFASRAMCRLVVGGEEVLAHIRVPFAVGDWVVADRGDPYVVRRVLERQTMLRRRDADGEHAQVLAANVDRVWIVQGLDPQGASFALVSPTR